MANGKLTMVKAAAAKAAKEVKAKAVVAEPVAEVKAVNDGVEAIVKAIDNGRQKKVRLTVQQKEVDKVLAEYAGQVLTAELCGSLRDSIVALMPKREKKAKRMIVGEDGKTIELKRPMTAYLLYSSETRAEHQAAHPDAKLGELSKFIAAAWKDLPEAEKATYTKAAAAAMEEYKLKLADSVEGSSESESEPEVLTEEQQIMKMTVAGMRAYAEEHGLKECITGLKLKADLQKALLEKKNPKEKKSAEPKSKKSAEPKKSEEPKEKAEPKEKSAYTEAQLKKTNVAGADGLQAIATAAGIATKGLLKKDLIQAILEHQKQQE